MLKNGNKLKMVNIYTDAEHVENQIQINRRSCPKKNQ